LDVLRDSNSLRDGEDFGELVVGNVVELCAVVFGDDELGGTLVLAGRYWRNWKAYRVAFAQRTDVKESKCLLALEDLHRRDLA